MLTLHFGICCSSDRRTTFESIEFYGKKIGESVVFSFLSVVSIVCNK